MGSQASALRAAAKRGDDAAIRAILDGKSEDQRRALSRAPATHNGKAALHYAATYGHGGVIKVLIEEGHADPNAPVAPNVLPKLRSFAGRTAIVLAAKHGHSDALVALATLGANPDAAIGAGFHALVISMAGGDAKAVAALLGAGANPRLVDPVTKMEPVQIAAAAAQAAMVEMLLDFGASPSITSPTNGDAPVHAAIHASCPAALSALLAYGADPNAPDARGAVPLTLAIEHKDVESVRALASAGADPRRAGPASPAPLLQAADAGLGDTVVVLLRCGADPNATSPVDGATALHAAASAGLVDATAELLAFGAAPDAQRTDGCTPLHVATAAGAESVAAALCAAGAYPAARDASGRTPLHASRAPSLSAMLLAYGGDPNAQDVVGETPAGSALRAGDAAVLATLLPYTAPPLVVPLFHGAVDHGTEWAVSAILHAARVAGPDVRAALDRVAFRKGAADGALWEVQRREGEVAGELAAAQAAHAAAHDALSHARHRLERVRATDAFEEAAARAVHDAAVAEYRREVERWEAEMRALGLPEAEWRHHGKRDPGAWSWPVSHHVRHAERDVAEAEEGTRRAHGAVAAAEERLAETRARREQLQAQAAAAAAMISLLMSVGVPPDHSMLPYAQPQRAVVQPRELRVAAPVPRLVPRVGVPAASRKAAA